MMSLLY